MAWHGKIRCSELALKYALHLIYDSLISMVASYVRTHCRFLKYIQERKLMNHFQNWLYKLQNLIIFVIKEIVYQCKTSWFIQLYYFVLWINQWSAATTSNLPRIVHLNIYLQLTIINTMSNVCKSAKLWHYVVISMLMRLSVAKILSQRLTQRVSFWILGPAWSLTMFY